MTDRERELLAEVEKLKAEVQQQKEIAYEYVDQHTEDLKEISTLKKQLQELHGAGSSDEWLTEKLFFARELMAGAGDCEGTDYYDALIRAFGLTEKFADWKDGQK